ncbi:NCS2 family permease [Halogeometricum limi]|uniref:Putative MFS transporter, AGZA family, xanthine/uracil permease n=1 Tax=Halogeometricum limi TaxID=555875 RepID=A0A1I6FXJ4_9EURY|nr:NCS2 family permease [Halogeometricum limi]SFR34659.1 putative MFS transporter, AGZA family, xanthine/uracil permease [Halogeometricum limi]
MGSARTEDASSDGVRRAVADFFELDEHDTDVRTEALAGLTTFLTMSYIIVVNPAILAGIEGVKPGILLDGFAPGQVQQMLAIVTILAAATGTFVMAVYANRPFAQVPGMGLNAFFAFTVVGALGVPWQTALAAVVAEGVLFLVLTVTGVRTYVVRAFPEPVKFAVGTGIGLFLAIIGLQAMGVVVDDGTTLVALGDLTNPVALVSVLGLFLTFGLYARGVRGAVVVGILATAVLGWAATAAGLAAPDAGLVTGTRTLSLSVPAVGAFDLLVPATGTTATYDISPLAGAFTAGLAGVDVPTFLLVVFMLFFVDFFNTAGAVTGVSQVAGFLNEDGNLPEVEKPLFADAVATTVGGMLGTSTVTTYIESASGVEAGGRTGLTALFVTLFLLVAVVFVPVVSLIPVYASHIAVVVVGVLMLQNVADIRWDDLSHVVPAGLTIVVMPFTYSIAYGIAAGIVSYPLVKLAAGERGDVRTGHWALALAFVAYFLVATGGVLGA